MIKLLKVLLVLLLLILLVLPIYTNVTVEKTFSRGLISPLTNRDLIILDTPILTIIQFSFTELNPYNLIVYFGGFPGESTTVNQLGYWLTWKPNGTLSSLWFIYEGE